MQHFDLMDHGEGMEAIESEIMDSVLSATADFDYSAVTEQDVLRAIGRDRLGVEDFAALLSPAAARYLEPMATRAKAETKRFFGNAVALFTPLYLANFCVNECTYCGFSCTNRIKRARLDISEIERELDSIAETGLQDILLLTGESRARTDVDYIGEGVKLAAQRFGRVGIEVYPVNTDEYAYLAQCGVDYVCVYQETYDTGAYDKLHLRGPKRVFPYRFNAQERAVRGGIKGVAFGALLGLSDFRKDAFATGLHAYMIQRKYPHAEIALSLPRLRPHIRNAAENSRDVHEPELLQVMLAYRLFLPYAGMTISTRERAHFRDNVVGLCATRISAGVSVGVGGHESEEKGDGQFDISDERSVDEVHGMILARGLEPVYADYIRV